MTTTDGLTLTVVVDGQERQLTREQLRRVLETGRLPDDASAPVSEASPTRERLMTDLQQRGFVREVRFRGVNGKRLFRFDAALEDLRIAVDYHGFGGFKGHAHTSKTSKAGDHDKLNEAQLCGWTYLVCDSLSVTSGRCLDHVHAAIERASGKE